MVRGPMDSMDLHTAFNRGGALGVPCAAVLNPRKTRHHER
jgi:hypothetical protein